MLAAHGAIGITVLADGVAAAFAAAGGALACAIEMQRAIDRQARRSPIALELRVSVGAGDVAWAGDAYAGAPVIEAQRLCAAAPAGGILIDEAVRLLAGTDAVESIDDAGELALRDVAHGVHAWSVRWTARRTVKVPFPPRSSSTRASPSLGVRRSSIWVATRGPTRRTDAGAPSS